MVVNSPFVSVQNMPTEEYLRRAGYPPGPCWYSHARVCTPCLPCYRNKCLACGGAHVCLCALVCKRRTGRYTTRQMLAELHSALRSMVAEEQDTKLYALPQLPVSYRFLPQKLLSKADAHGTATSHAGASAGCAYVRGSAPDLCAWAYARALVPIGSRGPPRLRRWAEGIRALANESQQAAERAQLSVRPSMHTCSVPIRRDRSGLLWVCVARVLERGWVPLPLAAAAAAATLEYCVSSTQRARAAFFRRARHRLNGLNRRRRTAAARPRSSRESSRST